MSRGLKQILNKKLFGQAITFLLGSIMTLYRVLVQYTCEYIKAKKLGEMSFRRLVLMPGT